MYERFTNGARETMQLANQEAQRLKHEYIGTEHVLLGLIKEAAGFGFQTLQQLGVVERVLASIKQIVAPRPDNALVTGKLPMTPRSKHVIELAIEQARTWTHDYVGTEHLLMGLIQEKDGCAAQVLAEHGVTEQGACEIISVLLSEKLYIVSERVIQYDIPDDLRQALDPLKQRLCNVDISDTEAVIAATKWIPVGAPADLATQQNK